MATGEPEKPIPQTQHADKYRHLPPNIKLEDTVSTKDTESVPDPERGRDPEQDFMLRNAGI